jgi:hypothetical protein
VKSSEAGRAEDPLVDVAGSPEVEVPGWPEHASGGQRVERVAHAVGGQHRLKVVAPGSNIMMTISGNILDNKYYKDFWHKLSVFSVKSLANLKESFSTQIEVI